MSIRAKDLKRTISLSQSHSALKLCHRLISILDKGTLIYSQWDSSLLKRIEIWTIWLAYLISKDSINPNTLTLNQITHNKIIIDLNSNKSKLQHRLCLSQPTKTVTIVLQTLQANNNLSFNHSNNSSHNSSNSSQSSFVNSCRKINWWSRNLQLIRSSSSNSLWLIHSQATTIRGQKTLITSTLERMNKSWNNSGRRTWTLMHTSSMLHLNKRRKQLSHRNLLTLAFRAKESQMWSMWIWSIRQDRLPARRTIFNHVLTTLTTF